MESPPPPQAEAVPATPPTAPEPPEPGGFPRWPLWLPLAGLGVGLTFGILSVSIVAGVSGGGSGAAGLTAAGTVLVDLAIVLSTLAFAGMVAPPKPWQLGLRGAPLRFTAAISAIGILAFFLFSLVYAA